MMDMSVASNTSLASLPRWERFGLLDERAELKFCRAVAGTVPRENSRRCIKLIRNLSAVATSKVILAKWLAVEPKVLLLDEP